MLNSFSKVQLHVLFVKFCGFIANFLTEGLTVLVQKSRDAIFLNKLKRTNNYFFYPSSEGR